LGACYDFKRTEVLQNLKLRFGDVGTEEMDHGGHEEGTGIGHFAIGNSETVAPAVPGKR
jgi:hypothetical protein